MIRLWEQSNITTSELISKINQLSDKQCLDTEELSLYQNKVTTIPKEIARFKNLTLLGVQGSYVSSAAEELSELKYLTHLHFASCLFGNPLKVIPAPVYDLINLTELTLNKCSLTYISHLIGNLVNLITLYLDENKITHLPTELVRLKKLNVLCICKNKLPKKLMNNDFRFGSAQILLKEIQKYYKPREDNIRKSIYQFLMIIKYRLPIPKDIRTLLAKSLWNTRQDQIWSTY